MAEVGRRDKHRPRRNFVGLLDYLDHRLGRHSGGGPEYQFWCPFCIDRQGSESDDRKLWCNLDRGVSHCFRCGYGCRDWFRFFRDLNGGGLRFEELALLKAGVSVPETDVASAVLEILHPEGAPELDDLVPVRCPPEMQRLAPHCRERTKPRFLRRAFQYLRERGVTSKQVVQFDVGFCVGGRYAQRLIFPVFQNGQQVYFTNRYCGSHKLKTLNPGKQAGRYTHRHCLLNYDNVVGQPRIGLVEGAFDTLSFPYGVGLMGKTLSPVQAALLEALVPRGLNEVIICVDADAQDQAEAIFQGLVRRIPQVRVLALEWGDPSERRCEIDALIATAAAPSVRDRVRHRLARKKRG